MTDVIIGNSTDVRDALDAPAQAGAMLLGDAAQGLFFDSGAELESAEGPCHACGRSIGPGNAVKLVLAAMVIGCQLCSASP